ncbi:tRNA(m5U54)methyltransferase [Friedmanniomyces endolithicus]|uniref:tRNA(M5U54)methyltransferase n=1 Tax=Friedmanniomyces endolithicus TaxID=329885 RepID=A0AAN6HBE7_9PEZI|nr:tRNA(m5U54)methyltransferase [Friedmanniomyces endolithicus]KAK0840796.1 tRNA(m5U54)methyltransferase [Friedmanniomyces endolithicus]KAK0875545.1 tRNA(m5U54)methyltransferase [Friedmanniomyces endolithicus]KAK0914013.1 tRNA(m5U54)methyltransferase [Friedmanniomyces endolithicus]KAK0918974.1 tRNA(m5U54)methyltransferase [Friedmanniomyces endolithicus]
MAQKRAFNEGKRHFKKNKKQKASVVEGSNEDVLLADVRRLLKETKLAGSQEDKAELPAHHSEIELDIHSLSSTGDGLAHKDGQVYVVPFTAPGDTITAKVFKHVPEESYTLTDFLSVKHPSPHRTETPRCPYFTQCSGCQFQHLPYAYQLEHKKTIVEKAYANFSNLPASSIPVVGETIGSPLQYGYRTKLTPHFDGPPGGRRDNRQGKKVTWGEVPAIGFMKKGTRKTMDIEECPIGTESVQRGLRRERERVKQNISQYQRGATLLLRESTERVEKDAQTKDEDEDVVVEDMGDHIHRKTCITDNKATSTEYVDNFRFDNPAGAFFQNNNSILPLITQYIRDNILGPASTPTTTNPSTTTTSKPQIKNLIDAYCGSGFFTIALSATFTHTIGIDIAAQSIASARHNADLNSLPANSTTFLAADANDLFASIPTSDSSSSNDGGASFAPEETVVVIDPPRKGCDAGFIRQLLRFGPARVVYVSCNVHTQARDVGWLVGDGGSGLADEEGLPVRGLYEIESLRGFDFFPMTGHVEGVAVLRRKRNPEAGGVGGGGGEGEGRNGAGNREAEEVAGKGKPAPVDGQDIPSASGLDAPAGEQSSTSTAAAT